MALNPKAYLVPDLLKKERLVQKPTRDGYGEGVVAAGAADPRVLVLCADLTESTRSLAFKKEFPERFVQFGVSEQSLAAIAAGMAMAGKIPFISSYAMFSPGRNWEMIRTNVALNDVPVKVVGAHAGVSVGPDGATHQAVEDMAIMRCIPRMTVVAPCDMVETRKTTVAVAADPGPCYFRFAREKSPVFTTEKTPFRLGRAETFRFGKHVTIVACGPLVYQALVAAEKLARAGIDCEVIDNHTVKPMDAKTIIASARKTRRVVTVEEHQVQGGMGSRVAEILAAHFPVPMEFVGVQDRFGESGQPDELIEAFGMGTGAIMKAVRTVLKRR